MSGTTKRFWHQASLAQDGDAFAVHLDGRPMRLPGGGRQILRVRQRSLAEALAEEWQRAGGHEGGTMSPEDVPLTRLAATAQERIAPEPAPTAAAIAAYGATDLLCYRAEQPEALVVRQHHGWQPWLDWAARRHDARLVATRGIMPVAQSAEALEALFRATAALDPFTLAGLGILVPAFGSLVLGLAVAEGALDQAEAFKLSVLDELYEEELWGEDAEAARRRATVARDVAEAARFVTLASPA